MKKLIVLPYGDKLQSELGMLLNKLGKSSVLILGCGEAELSLPQGIEKLLLIPEIENYTAALELYAESTAELIEAENFTGVFFYDDRIGRSLCGRTAAKLKKPCFTDVNDVKFEDEKICIRRRAYGGNLQAELKISEPAVFTLSRESLREKPELFLYKGKRLEPKAEKPSWLIREEKESIKVQTGLSSAKILLAAGKGIGSGENYKRLLRLGEKMKASVGASRAVVLSGWAGPESIIGQSGTIAAPELCIVFGASGAAPFLIGVEQAKKLVAINTDSAASIFKAADYGIVADCTEILSQMEKLLNIET